MKLFGKMFANKKIMCTFAGKFSESWFKVINFIAIKI